MRDPIQKLEHKQWGWRIASAIAAAVGLMFSKSLLRSGQILDAVLLTLIQLGGPMYLEYVYQRQIQAIKRAIASRLHRDLVHKGFIK